MQRTAINRKAVAFAAALALAPLSAQAFTAQNSLWVQQSGPSEIAVSFQSWADDTDYWCAAGDFAARVLRVSNATRLFRASPKPRGQGQGITFTLDPARAAPGAGISSFGTGGRDGSISVGQAVGSYCEIFSRFRRF